MDRTKKFLLWIGGLILLLVSVAVGVALWAIRKMELDKNKARTAKANESRRKSNGQMTPEEIEKEVTQEQLANETLTPPTA